MFLFIICSCAYVVGSWVGRQAGWLAGRLVPDFSREVKQSESWKDDQEQ